jgi:hypothetical protein
MNISNLLDYLLPHLSFVLAAFTFGVIGSVLKARLWTKERAGKSRVMWWLRATLPLHPVAAGVTIGIAGSFLGLGASPGVESAADLALYYGAAGAFSSWAYAAVKHFFRSRGVTVRLPDLPRRR